MSSSFQNDRQDITIVAGGWSVVGDRIDLGRLPGTIIAVNDAALHLPRVDVILSMDRKWVQNRWGWLERLHRTVYVRDSFAGRLEPAGWVKFFKNDHQSSEMADDENTLNGSNSGMCAVQLACHMLPGKLFLVGFDMQRGPKGEAHWYDPYPWNEGATKPPTLSRWATEFAPIKRWCELYWINVYNCSTHSLIDCFPRMTATELSACAT